MKKIKMPYALRKAILLPVIGGLTLGASCKKEPEPTPQPDPVKDRIEVLTGLEKVQATDVRNAVEPAKTVEADISTFFGIQYTNAVTELNKPETKLLDGDPKNILDSAYVFRQLVFTSKKSLGDPLPVNNTTMTALHDKSGLYIVTKLELDSLRNVVAQRVPLR